MGNKNESGRRKINLRGEKWILDMKSKCGGQKINLGDEK